MFSSSVRTILNKAAASTLEIFESSLLLAESIFTVSLLFCKWCIGLLCGASCWCGLWFAGLEIIETLHIKVSTLDFIREQMSCGQCWGFNRDPGSKHSCFPHFSRSEINSVARNWPGPLSTPYWPQATLWFQLVPSCPRVLPLPCLPHSPPPLGEIRTHRQCSHPSISITVNAALFPSGQDPKPLVVEWIKYVKTFYLIWQLIFLSPTVDSNFHS